MAGKIFEIAFNLAAKVGSSFKGTFSSASTQLYELNKTAKTARDSLRDLEKNMKSGKITATAYAASYAKLTKQLEATEAAQKKLSRSMSMQKTAGAVHDKSESAMGTAAVAATGLAIPAVASISFETEMAQVAKQVDGARTETGKLSEIGLAAKADIMQLSNDLMTMPDEVAKAYALGARTGVKGTENLKKITEMGVMMGTAFEMPAEKVTTNMAKIGNSLGYNLGTSEGIAKLESLADKINYVDDQTIATGEDLIDFMTRTAGVANGMLPTISEGFMVGLGGALLSCGEKSETAGRAMNVMFTKFAAAEAESDKFQGALEAIGLTASQVSQGMATDADTTIKSIFERVNQLDAVSRNNVLSELIGKDHIDTVTKITGNYDKFIESIRLANSEAAKGSVRKEFDIMNQTTKRKLEGAKASGARSLIAIGDAMLPGIADKAEKVGALAEKVGTLAKEYPNLASTLVVTAVSFTGFALAAAAATWVVSAGISPLIGLSRWLFFTRVATDGTAVASRAATAAQWLWNLACGAGRLAMSGLGLATHVVRLGAVAGATGAMTAAQWLWNVALSANPIGLVILGITALIGTGYLLYQNWDTIRNFFTLMWNDPLAAVDVFTTGIRSYFEPVLNWLDEKWNKIKNAFSSISLPSFSGAGAKSVDIAQNASGGIYGQGAFLTSFAENSAEAAIPIDGSPRALSLWAQTGQMLGINLGGSGGGISIDAPYSPVIYLGSGASIADLQAALEEERARFKRMLEDLLEEQRRLSYG